jgi:hypothetical protein
MNNALHIPLTGAPVESSASNHGAEQAVADALGLTFTKPAPLPPPLPKQPSQNVIARHWRGELSLPRSYWINHLVLEHPPLKLTRSHRGRNSFGIPEARSRR